MSNLTEKSKALFVQLAKDAGDWNGTPLLPELTAEQRGNLTDLKKHGLLETFKDDGCDWISFLDTGIEMARDFGIEIEVY